LGNPHWPEKLCEGLDNKVGREIREKIMTGCEKLTKLDEKGKAAWTKRMLDKLDRLVPDKKTRYEIMVFCSCQCADDLIEQFREEYKKSQDIDLLLEKMYKNPFYIRPVREGNVIYFTKVAHDVEGFEKAKTDEEKRYCYCHCDYIKAAVEKTSPTHCYCSSGWYKRIWEGILERRVRVEMVKSIMRGDDCCQFAVYI